MTLELSMWCIKFIFDLLQVWMMMRDLKGLERLRDQQTKKNKIIYYLNMCQFKLQSA